MLVLMQTLSWQKGLKEVRLKILKMFRKSINHNSKQTIALGRLLEHFEKNIAHSEYATPQRSSIGSFLYVPGTKMHSC